ncbi:hypothetical protein NLG97_g7682 [Lecanicillium saksenae]|uniref:Uncharacterized protein n=1 Tax=Lecanicillium saksenae TaxID=468837 RepID=A0ACC1QL65_9HYPO|nr:hypothetical protein NLG97_g7682 [Lecanicillium saksenae]
MVGRKRRSNAATGRGGNNASAVTGGPSIYREMLAEAGIEGSSSHDSASGEPPIKRRRPGGQRDTQEKRQSAIEPIVTVQKPSDDEGEDEDEDEDVEFLDVPLPPAQVQTIELDSDDDSEEDEDDIIFEDVNFSAAVDKGKDAASSSESKTHELELNLTAHQAANASSKRTADRRKPITKEERDRRLNVHKTHLLCLLSHVARRNHWRLTT